MQKILVKIDKNLGRFSNTNEFKENLYAKIWNKIIALKQITPKQFAAWIASFVWKVKKKLRCKICHRYISMRHLINHIIHTNF